MNDGTVFNLIEMFKAVEQAAQIGYEKYDQAVFEYCGYIGSSPQLSGIVKKMALDHDIDKDTFFRLLMFSSLRNRFRDKRLGREASGAPLFWDKEVEKETGVMARFLQMLRMEEKRLGISKKNEISIFDVVLPKEDKDEAGIAMETDFFELRMIHNQILVRASEATQQLKVVFESDSGLLKIGARGIKIRKFTEQYHALRVVFTTGEGVRKEWMFSEMAEIIDLQKGYADKDFHNYFSAIKRRVAAETGISDLFFTTNQSVKINPKYL